MADENDPFGGDDGNGGRRKKAPSRYKNAPYDVGKGKPPIEHQFKSGGRPGPGRPRGSRNRSDLDKVLDELIVVGEDRLGRPIRKPGRRVANLQLRNKAVQGDLRAIKMMKDHELKMAAIKARRGEGPPSAEELLKQARVEEKKKELSSKIVDLLDSVMDLSRDGWLVQGGAPRLAPWVYEAAGDYREKLGLRRDPGHGRWSPHKESDSEDEDPENS